MAVCVNKPMLMAITTNMNMQTGEVLIRSQGFWAEVMQKLQVTDQQVSLEKGIV